VRQRAAVADDGGDRIDQPLCGAGCTNVTNARASAGATTVDQSIGGSIGVLIRPALSR
jgi:hypothetical protein